MTNLLHRFVTGIYALLRQQRPQLKKLRNRLSTSSKPFPPRLCALIVQKGTKGTNGMKRPNQIISLVSGCYGRLQRNQRFGKTSRFVRFVDVKGFVLVPLRLLSEVWKYGENDGADFLDQGFSTFHPGALERVTTEEQGLILVCFEFRERRLNDRISAINAISFLH